MTVDYPDYATPQAHATAIAGTGAPLLKLPTQLGSASAATLAGGATVTLFNGLSIGQIGWEIGLQTFLPAAAGTVPFFRLGLSWLDPSQAVQIATDRFVGAAGNGLSNPIITGGMGLAKGDKLTATLTNLDPAQTLTYTYVMNETSHPLVYPQWRQINYTAVPPITFTYPAADLPRNLIAVFSPSLAAGASSAVLCGPRSGKWRLIVDNLAGATQLTVKITDPSTSGVAAGADLDNFTVAASGRFDVEFDPPYGPVLVTLTNNGTTGTITPTFTATLADY